MLPEMIFQVLEEDDPALVCCHPYGLTEDRRILRGGRRACDEAHRDSAVALTGPSRFVSFGCMFGYVRGCPQFLGLEPTGLSGGSWLSPHCRRTNAPPR
jgi:hypothetical protein